MSETKKARRGKSLRRRKARSRPLPKWLHSREGQETIARQRCLLLLSVLSGEVPVSEAIARARISRNTYYELETRALKGMIAALHPLQGREAPGTRQLTAALQRIAQLERQNQHLAQHQRRSRRLLWMGRKTLRVPLAGPRGRWPRGLRCASAWPEKSAPARTAKPPSSPTPPGAGSP